jgi:predicted DNA-binding transcriptional regulator AlpA
VGPYQMKKNTYTARTPNLKTTDRCLLSRKEVAKMLSLSVPTVKRYQQKGLIKPIIVNARVVRYRYEEILEFIEQAAA